MRDFFTKLFTSVVGNLEKGIEQAAYAKAIHELERMGMKEQADNLRKERAERLGT
jgi:hypothetical protein